MQVLVQHTVKYNRNGDAAGTEFYKHGRRVLNAVYMYRHKVNGHQVVRLESGDVFPVIEQSGVFNGRQFQYKTAAE